MSGFTKGLRRALGLTHLSQAVVSVIQDPERLRQMLNDITKVDLESIEVNPVIGRSAKSVFLIIMRM